VLDLAAGTPCGPQGKSAGTSRSRLALFLNEIDLELDNIRTKRDGNRRRSPGSAGAVLAQL
jgi:hypothetical protein